jgi:DNA-binding response OmpR family regulator
VSPAVKASPKKRVLIVDDDRPALEATMEGLRGECSVLIAPDVLTATHVLHKQAVDLIILDVHPGEDSGFDFLDSLRGLSDIPVLLISDSGTKETLIKGLRARASDYLDKPFTASDLRERVRALIGHGPRLDHIAGRIRRFIQEQYMHNWTVERLARELRLSVRTMRQVFRRRYRQSVMAFREEVRVTRAMDLLVGTDLSIKEVAAAVGYCDPRYFTRVFQQHLGKCPRDFRTAHREASPSPLLPPA